MRSFQGTFPTHLLLASSFALFGLLQSLSATDTTKSTLSPGSSGYAIIRQLKVLGSKDSIEIEVDASDRVTPQAQVLTGPDRLVLDFPRAVPGVGLRSQSIYVGAVKDIRAGLFCSKPPVTRLVIDLDSPETYQIFPTGRSVMIKVATSARSGASIQVDPWREPAVQPVLAANAPSAQPPGQADAPPDPPKPSLDVEFVNGLLTIKADRVTLSEILRAVQQRTGAEISIAPGAEQEKVVSDFGPAPAQEVLAHLLNGSKFNFLILNASADPQKLDRVILTPRTDGGPTPLPPLQTAEQPNQPEAGLSPPPGQPGGPEPEIPQPRPEIVPPPDADNPHR